MAVRPLDAPPGRALQPEAAPKPRPHLQVVPLDYVSARARRRRARRLVVLGGVLVAVAMFGVVAFHVVLTQGQLDLQHLQARAAAASVREQQLRLEAARLESPERVVDDARRLGMVPPSSVRYLSPDGRAPSATPTPPPPTAGPKTSPGLSTGAVRPGSGAQYPNLERSSGISATKPPAKPALGVTKTTPTTAAAKPVTTVAPRPTR